MSHNTLLSAGTLKGTQVVNPEGVDIGSIEELMIDIDTGFVAYAVLSFGGILGIGDKYFAIPWRAFEIDTEEEKFILDVDKEKLQKADGFDKNDWPDMSDLEWRAKLYDYYGTAPYWS